MIGSSPSRSNGYDRSTVYPTAGDKFRATLHTGIPRTVMDGLKQVVDAYPALFHNVAEVARDALVHQVHYYADLQQSGIVITTNAMDAVLERDRRRSKRDSLLDGGDAYVELLTDNPDAITLIRAKALLSDLADMDIDHRELRRIVNRLSATADS